MQAEAQNAPAGLAEKAGETMAGLLKLKGALALVKPGSLPNDGKVISDERG